jgi:hypothetical protein
MKLELHWRGPYGAGLFPEAAEAVEQLMGAGVYLRVKHYAGGRTVSYVGQSKQILARIDRHISSVLSLSHGLRDDAGRSVFVPSFDARLRALNDIEAVAALATAEAKRMRFYCAFCEDGFDSDYLSLVEYLLMQRLRDAENINRPPVAKFDNEVVVESDYTALAAADEALLRGLIGEAPLRIEEAVA